MVSCEAQGASRLGSDFPIRDVARATSAAPTYFRPGRLLLQPPTAMVDGGVFADNRTAASAGRAR